MGTSVSQETRSTTEIPLYTSVKRVLARREAEKVEVVPPLEGLESVGAIQDRNVIFKFVGWGSNP